MVFQIRSFVTVQTSRKQFLVLFKDYKDAQCLSRRLEVREKHLKEAIAAEKSNTLGCGGAILDDHESSKMRGSFIIYNAESVEDVQKMIVNDPYYKNKVWEKWEILPVKVAVGLKN